jgi:hypothetical protein
VSAKVARATEGAAPNSPAKLFGFKVSPNAENVVTVSLQQGSGTASALALNGFVAPDEMTLRLPDEPLHLPFFA